MFELIVVALRTHSDSRRLLRDTCSLMQHLFEFRDMLRLLELLPDEAICSNVLFALLDSLRNGQGQGLSGALVIELRAISSIRDVVSRIGGEALKPGIQVIGVLLQSLVDMESVPSNELLVGVRFLATTCNTVWGTSEALAKLLESCPGWRPKLDPPLLESPNILELFDQLRQGRCEGNDELFWKLLLWGLLVGDTGERWPLVIVMGDTDERWRSIVLKVFKRLASYDYPYLLDSIESVCESALAAVLDELDTDLLELTDLQCAAVGTLAEVVASSFRHRALPVGLVVQSLSRTLGVAEYQVRRVAEDNFDDYLLTAALRALPKFLGDAPPALKERLVAEQFYIGTERLIKDVHAIGDARHREAAKDLIDGCACLREVLGDHLPEQRERDESMLRQDLR